MKKRFRFAIFLLVLGSGALGALPFPLLRFTQYFNDPPLRLHQTHFSMVEKVLFESANLDVPVGRSNYEVALEYASLVEDTWQPSGKTVIQGYERDETGLLELFIRTQDTSGEIEQGTLYYFNQYDRVTRILEYFSSPDEYVGDEYTITYSDPENPVAVYRIQDQREYLLWTFDREGQRTTISSAEPGDLSRSIAFTFDNGSHRVDEYYGEEFEGQFRMYYTQDGDFWSFEYWPQGEFLGVSMDLDNLTNRILRAYAFSSVGEVVYEEAFVWGDNFLAEYVYQREDYWFRQVLDQAETDHLVYLTEDSWGERGRIEVTFGQYRPMDH